MLSTCILGISICGVLHRFLSTPLDGRAFASSSLLLLLVYGDNYFARWGLKVKSSCGRPGGISLCVLVELESNEGYITIPMRLR